MIRKCKKCSVEKPLEEFIISKGCFHDRGHTCKECGNSYQKAYGKSWRVRNADKFKARYSAYYGSEKGREIKRKSNEKYRKSQNYVDSIARKKLRPVLQSYKEGQARYESKYKALLKERSELDCFVMSEGKRLAKLREVTTGIKWSIDHIIPISKGGTHVHTNIQVVPLLWNQMKIDKLWPRFFGLGG